MTASPTPSTQKTEKGTKYVVLEQDPDSSAQFTLIGNFAATSAAAAIRKVGADAGEGTYIAVPARSFVPTKVTVETTKTVKLG